MGQTFIKGLKNGDFISGFYLLSSMTVKTLSSGQTLMLGTLTDQSGSIGCKVWGYDGDVSTGNVVYVEGKAGSTIVCPR